MTLIRVPRPPQSALDKDRPLSSLLKTQIEHLYEAEGRLPSRYRTDIYANAIRSEGEAARYVQAVTEAIRKAHADAAAQRARRTPKPKRVIDIAAAASREPKRKRRATTEKKRKTARPKRKM